MDWTEALEIVVSITRHERFRWLTREANPDVESRDAYRRQVLKMAGHPAPEPTPEDVALRAHVARRGGCCG